MSGSRYRVALKIVLIIGLVAFLILFGRDELDFIYQNF